MVLEEQGLVEDGDWLWIAPKKRDVGAVVLAHVSMQGRANPHSPLFLPLRGFCCWPVRNTRIHNGQERVKESHREIENEDYT